MTCSACTTRINAWYDSKPSEVLPQFGITFGSGAAYDITPAAITARASSRVAAWRALVREQTAAIKAACKVADHA